MAEDNGAERRLVVEVGNAVRDLRPRKCCDDWETYAYSLAAELVRMFDIRGRRTETVRGREDA